LHGSSRRRKEAFRVRLVLSPAPPFPALRGPVDGACGGDLVLPRRAGRRGSRPVAGRLGHAADRRGALLVRAVPLVPPLLRGVARNLRRALDVVRAAPVGALVHRRFGVIIFATYLQVEASVATNNWYGPFYCLEPDPQRLRPGADVDAVPGQF